jgi:hypothetical protein
MRPHRLYAERVLGPIVDDTDTGVNVVHPAAMLREDLARAGAERSKLFKRPKSACASAHDLRHVHHP